MRRTVTLLAGTLLAVGMIAGTAVEHADPIDLGSWRSVERRVSS